MHTNARGPRSPMQPGLHVPSHVPVVVIGTAPALLVDGGREIEGGVFGAGRGAREKTTKTAGTGGQRGGGMMKKRVP